MGVCMGVKGGIVCVGCGFSVCVGGGGGVRPLERGRIFWKS